MKFPIGNGVKICGRVTTRDQDFLIEHTDGFVDEFTGFVIAQFEQDKDGPERIIVEELKTGRQMEFELVNIRTFEFVDLRRDETPVPEIDLLAIGM